MQIRLITSRETRRWVIPKGWPMKGLSPAKAAAREAYEEAGLLGSIATEPVGMYSYEKRLTLQTVPCDVMVFALKVKRYMKKWPERAERFGFWFSIESAAAAVQEEELSQLILAFGAMMAERFAQKRSRAPLAVETMDAEDELPVVRSKRGVKIPPKGHSKKAEKQAKAVTAKRAGVSASGVDVTRAETPAPVKSVGGKSAGGKSAGGKSAKARSAKVIVETRPEPKRKAAKMDIAPAVRPGKSGKAGTAAALKAGSKADQLKPKRGKAGMAAADQGTVAEGTTEKAMVPAKAKSPARTKPEVRIKPEAKAKAKARPKAETKLQPQTKAESAPKAKSSAKAKSPTKAKAKDAAKGKAKGQRAMPMGAAGDWQVEELVHLPPGLRISPTRH
ncbi:NUDIX domain-containing protein [Azorhizobium oxalatiphilum]|uniref:NUDIX domain-containing protein n=1 Tax=Azorhizobium oxalatiphilum TaxID=980631 RepID=UPI0027E5B8ED|nr:NUDIX domain-containing protein [Azorhizobium oxalatiphilum]